MSSVVTVTFTVDLQNSRIAVPKEKAMTFRIVLVVCFMFCKAYGSDYKTSKVLLDIANYYTRTCQKINYKADTESI